MKVKVEGKWYTVSAVTFHHIGKENCIDDGGAGIVLNVTSPALFTETMPTVEDAKDLPDKLRNWLLTTRVYSGQSTGAWKGEATLITVDNYFGDLGDLYGKE